MEKSKKKENVTEEIQCEGETITDYHIGYYLGLHLILPVAGLILILFNQKTLFNKILLQIDRNCVSVFCPSFSRREKLIKWACNRLPFTWSSQSKTLSGGITDLWMDGSLLCTLINTAIPGACPNPHRHWRKPPTHAQAIAYKYFGLVPMFTDEELSNGLTTNLERNFLHYLSELQQLINKLSEKSYNVNNVSSKYVPRGMGLVSGEQHRKVTFYVYQDENVKTVTDSTVIIQIRGPYGTYGQAVIPRFKDGLFKVPDVKIMSDFVAKTKFKSKTHFVKSFAISFLRYHKKHMGDNIVIDITMEDDRARVTYIPRNYGMYEITMIANGELLKGSPFHVNVSKNTSGIEENFEMEEKMPVLSSYKKRKIISKTIDFIEGKVCVNKLKENSIREQDEENLKKNSETTRNTSLSFTDVVHEITKIEKFGKKNMDEKNDDQVSEKNLTEKQKNGEEIEQMFRKETDLSFIPTIEEEDLEENENYCNNDTEKKLPDILLGQYDEKAMKESLPSLITNKSESGNRAQNTIKTHLEKDTDKIETYAPIVKSIKEELMLKMQSIKSNEDICRKETVNNNSKNELHIFDELEDNNNRGLREKKSQIKQLEKEENIHNNSHSDFHLKKYSQPKIKLEEYTTKAKINKLKIPDKFSADKDIDSKDLKNFINNTSKNKFNTKFTDNLIHTIIQNETPDNMNNAFSIKQQFDNMNENGNKISTEAINEDNETNKESNFYLEEQPKSEPNEYTSYVNVKKILQNYQFVSSQSQESIQGYNAKNLQNKIKHLPHDLQKELNDCKIKNESGITQQIVQNKRNKVDQMSVLPIETMNNKISESSPSNSSTSPICEDHIVPEVSYSQMSVAEKRKIFAQPTLEDRQASIYSSSEENDEKIVEMSSNRRHLQFEGLSVMNVLGSLKKSENPVKQKMYSNNSTISLPNISDLPDEYVFPQIVKNKKDFWEEVSSRSSSSLSSAPMRTKTTTKNTNPGKIMQRTFQKSISERSLKTPVSDINKSIEDLESEASNELNSLPYSTEDESMNYSFPSMSSETDSQNQMSVKDKRFFWEQIHHRSTSSLSIRSQMEHPTKDEIHKLNKPWNRPLNSTNLGDKMGETYKSENNILSLGESQYSSYKKCKSVEDSLDYCEIISIKERKKMLMSQDNLKDDSEKESKGKIIHTRTNIVHVTSSVKSHVEDGKLHGNRTKSITENDINLNKPLETDKDITSTKPPSSTSHFRKAIKYFRNLESKSHRSRPPEKLKKAMNVKKLSLDIGLKKNRKTGGSLNLPNLSNRFALVNIYDDVFGSGRNHFKGVPNRSALVDALATFSRKDENGYYRDDSEDNIRFDLFKKRMKSKKRKSLKSVFDVSY